MSIMNTQSHILMGALLFGRSVPRMAFAGALGGMVPDIAMFVIVAGLRMRGHSLQEIFGHLYWERWWQVTNALGHSFLIWGPLVILAGFALKHTFTPHIERAQLLFAFSASALLHSLIDFLCHREDAHMHLWPLTDWKFISPVSYWSPSHYGNWFALFEAGLGLVMALLLLKRYRATIVRIALALAILLYASVPAYFILSFASV